MVLSAFVAAAVAAQSPPITSTQILGVDVPDDFQIGNHQRNDRTEIIEIVEPPETVENWSKLVTELAFFRTAQIGSEVFYEHWLNAMRRACPNMKDSLIRGSVDGHPAIRGNLSCPNNPQTGRSENLNAFLVQGDTDLMMAQVAFRHSITLADTVLINRIARSLKVCDQKRMDACSKRKATGFRPGP